MESVFLKGILVWPLNANGNWAKFFQSGKFSGNLAGKFPEMCSMGNLTKMTKMLHMIKKFELSKNLNKKLILVKNIYLAKFVVKLEK